MFKLLRFYSVTSFIIIFIAAALLTLFYRQVTIHWIDHLAKSGNLALAQTVLNSFRPELAAHLSTKSDGDSGDRDLAWQKLPTELVGEIGRMTEGTLVGSIKIYDRNGKVLFSTQKEQIGGQEGNHAGFRSALDGKEFSFMTYRDTFNRLEGTTADDNLMHTYIPISNGPNEPVLGVLEIHTDMNHLIRENDKVLLVTWGGAEAILALLYAVLFFVVRYAKNIIESQQKTIQERTASLEILSKQLLKNEEAEKKKIAVDLHEGLAQTLSAIKVNVENSSGHLKAYDVDPRPMEAIVPVLQSAIQEVRSIATELRPSSLDDLGLLPTVNWFCREFEHQHAGISVRREVSVSESAIPAPLKIVIYRIIESTFRNIAQYSNTDQIRFALHLADDMIHLIIGDMPEEQSSVAAITPFDPGSDPQFRFAEMKERTSLSGGRFASSQDNAGWVTLRASWAC